MFSPKDWNRFQAFGCHLLASAVVVSFCVAFVMTVWYPAPLADASGLHTILVLLLAVDLILGPVITLIIFDSKKKELRRDLAIVFVIQVSALLYGLHTVFVARPVYMVFNSGRFDTVYANEISAENLTKAVRPEFRSLPYWGPKFIAATLPDDPKAREEIIRSAVAGGEDVQHMPQYYVPYTQQRDEVLKHIKLLSELKSFNREKLNELDVLQKKYSSLHKEVGYVPLKAKVNDLAVVVSRATGEVLEITDLSPWKNW